VSDHEQPNDADYLQTTKWSVPQFLLVFAVGFGAALMAGILVFAAAGDELSVAAFAVVFGVQAGASLAAMWWLSRTRGTGSLAADFGLELHLSDWWALLAGFGLQIAVALLMAPLIQLLFPEGPPQQEVATLTASSSGVTEGLLVVVMVGLLAPLVEEMMFRGMLLSRAVRSLSRAWAVVATAAAFAGVHLLDPSAIAVLPGLFTIGVVLAIVSLRRGDLSLAIPLHAGVNLTAALLLVFGDQITAWLEDAQANLEQIEGLVRLFF